MLSSLQTSSSPTLSELPSDSRLELYVKCHLSSLGRLCQVSSLFRDEIYVQIFKITIEANRCCTHSSNDLDNLLEYTKKNGKQIKWLTPILPEDPTDSNIGCESKYNKMLAILGNCPNLSSLFIKIKAMDYNCFFNEVNSQIIPKLVFLENFCVSDTLLTTKKQRKKYDPLKIDGLERLQKIGLDRIDLNEDILKQLQELPENIDLHLSIACFQELPEPLVKAIEALPTRYKISWGFNNGDFSFPENALKSFQNIKCHQELKITLNNKPTEKQILLLKPFNEVSLTVILYPHLIWLTSCIEQLLPELKFKVSNVSSDITNTIYKVPGPCDQSYFINTLPDILLKETDL